MLLSSTTLNGAVSNDSNNNITMSVGNTVIANVNSSGIFFESGKKAIYTGAVLQVVQTAVSTAQSHSGGTPASVGLDVNITPSSSASKILVTLNAFIGGSQTANEYLYVYRASTQLGGKPFSVVRIGQDAQAEYQCIPVSWSYLDSPASTSSLAYSFKFATNYSNVYLNRPANQGGFSDVLISTITVMEIAG